MILLACAVLVLCSIGIALSVWRLTKSGGVHGFGDVLKSPFLILICLFCIAVVISLLIRSQYVVTDEHFIMQFGFIKSTYSVKEITSVLLNTDNQKLTVYMGEQYFVATVNPQWNNDLVQALRKVNPDIEYSFTLADKKDKENK
jgi:hypothetical protein